MFFLKFDVKFLNFTMAKVGHHTTSWAVQINTKPPCVPIWTVLTLSESCWPASSLKSLLSADYQVSCPWVSWRLVLFPCLVKRVFVKISFATFPSCEGSASVLCSTVHFDTLHFYHFPCLICSSVSSMIWFFFHLHQNRKISVIVSSSAVFSSTNSAAVHFRHRSMLPSSAGIESVILSVESI